MNNRGEPRNLGRWCPVHRTRDPRLEAPCPYCHRQMHLHTGHVKQAKRGIASAIICGRCIKVARLVVAYDGKRWELVVQDQGQPAIQTHLKLTIH